MFRCLSYNLLHCQLTSWYSRAKPATRPRQPEALDGNDATELGNRFQALDLEDVEDVEEPLTEEQFPNTATTSTIDVLEDEDTALSLKLKNILKVLTLFEDLQVGADSTQSVRRVTIY